MSDGPCFVGIDGAKAQLDIAQRSPEERWAMSNDASGVTTRVNRLQDRHPTRIVLDATGGLERAVTSALATAGLPVVVVNRRQVRDCARATGQLATTNALITWLNERLTTLDDDRETTLRASPLWRENDDLVQRTPGIGPACARTFLRELPTLGTLNLQQSAALA